MPPPLVPGLIYAVQEEKPRICYDLLRSLLDGTSPNVAPGVYRGLVVTRSFPPICREIRGLGSLPVYWLTSNVQSTEPVIAPSAITRLNLVVTDFLRNEIHGVILLDGLEYLITQNSFEIILRLIQSWNDRIMTSKSLLVYSIDPLAVSKQELHLLLRESEDVFTSERLRFARMTAEPPVLR